MSGYPVDELMRRVVAHPGLAPKVGKLLAFESLYYLMRDMSEFHSAVSWAMKNASRNFHNDYKLKPVKKKFEELLDDQAWKNVQGAIVEAVATLGFGALIKGAQVTIIVGRAFQAINLASDLSTIFQTISDFQSPDLSADHKVFLKDPKNRMKLERATKLVAKEAEKAAQEEMNRWGAYLLSGVSLYHRFMKEKEFEYLHPADMNSRELKEFIEMTAARMIAEGQVWEKVFAQVPQPGLIEIIFSRRVNPELVTAGVDYVRHDIIVMLYDIYGSGNIEHGKAGERYDHILEVLKDLEWDLDVEWRGED